MKIILNGEPCEVDGRTIKTALDECGYGDAAVATALNGEFVPKDLRSETAVTEGDLLEVLAPMQGG
ncbi:sulfur carrier protein ThiS [Inquilinus sp. CA228]|uniref:sulfur carrier protein ThiS n=1 Tax=Inquilinus sp. CA228 TaxID=3455609 RepID=UPI003F8D2C6A